jgi:NADH:ubiquinone oxidoreductase subunit H
MVISIFFFGGWEKPVFFFYLLSNYVVYCV